MIDVDSHIVSVRILGKNYNIKCPPEQADALNQSAQFIEQKLHEMKQQASSTNTDRILVVMALNLCHELNVLKSEKNQLSHNVENKLNNIQSRIQSFLAQHEELSIA